MAQDEVGTIPYSLPVKNVDVKIGGNEIDRLRRWYKQGKLQRSRGLVASRFPSTATPRQVAGLIRRGKLQNARFAAAVIARGTRKEQPRRPHRSHRDLVERLEERRQDRWQVPAQLENRSGLRARRKRGCRPT